MKRALVAGHICLDIIPSIDHPFQLAPGRLYEVGTPTIATGGAVSNTGIAMHILGVPTTLVGRIGDDSFGQSVLEVVSRRGEHLTDGMNVVPGETTSYTVVINIPGTDRMFLHCPGANGNFTSADVADERLAEADLFHFGYPAFMAATYADDGAELTALYRRAKQAGLTTCLDLGLPDSSGPAGKADWQAILRSALHHVDVFMPSADELLYALGCEHVGSGDSLSPAELNPLAARLLDMGPGIVAVKMGARGMYVRTGAPARIAALGKARPKQVEDWANRELWFPIYREDRFLGATGAGDTAIAGFLAALLRGLSVEEAGCAAAAVGACNVEAPDALGGIRSWEDTLARVEAGWETVPPDVSEPTWRTDGAGILHGPADGVAP